MSRRCIGVVNIEERCVVIWGDTNASIKKYTCFRAKRQPNTSELSSGKNFNTIQEEGVNHIRESKLGWAYLIYKIPR